MAAHELAELALEAYEEWRVKRRAEALRAHGADAIEELARALGLGTVEIGNDVRWAADLVGSGLWSSLVVSAYELEFLLTPSGSGQQKQWAVRLLQECARGCGKLVPVRTEINVLADVGMALKEGRLVDGHECTPADPAASVH